MEHASTSTRRTLDCRAKRIATIACTVLLSACSTTGMLSIAASAVGAGMEAAGLKAPAKVPQAPRIRIALNAGQSLNTTEDGRSLALLVKVYQLRSTQSLSTARAAALLDPGQEREALGDDLLSVRELTLTPGARRNLDEPLAKGANAIAVVALFRAPAAKRWRYAFDAAASVDTGISLGFHGCAMTVGAGALTGEEADSTAISLAGVHCGRPADWHPRTAASSLQLPG